jgi:hypothetical protein
MSGLAQFVLEVGAGANLGLQPHERIKNKPIARPRITSVVSKRTTRACRHLFFASASWSASISGSVILAIVSKNSLAKNGRRA